MNRIMIFAMVLVMTFALGACSGGVNISDPPGNGGGITEGRPVISETDLLILESYPVQVMVAISGELPTPCDDLKIDISGPNENNEFMIEFTSLADEGQTCITVIEPFQENVSLPLAGLADGEYSVFVNGKFVGKFTYPA